MLTDEYIVAMRAKHGARAPKWIARFQSVMDDLTEEPECESTTTSWEGETLVFRPAQPLSIARLTARAPEFPRMRCREFLKTSVVGARGLGGEPSLPMPAPATVIAFHASSDPCYARPLQCPPRVAADEHP
jgi:hypothetical protein